MKWLTNFVGKLTGILISMSKAALADMQSWRDLYRNTGEEEVTVHIVTRCDGKTYSRTIKTSYEEAFQCRESEMEGLFQEAISQMEKEAIAYNPKYVLCPGHVKSINDGDTHYITAQQLAFLWKVNMRDCDIAEKGPFSVKRKRLNHVLLGPRYKGDYDLSKHAHEIVNRPY